LEWSGKTTMRWTTLACNFFSFLLFFFFFCFFVVWGCWLF
jgi:hypothetical protein